MEVKIEKPKSYIREIKISVPYRDLEEEQKKIAEMYRNSATVPGFRKGKAPVSVILNRFNKEINKEAQDNVIKNAFMRAVKDNNLNPITFADIDGIKIPEGKGNVTFRARFQVIPDFELKLDGIKTSYKPRKVSTSDVKKVISDLQGKYTTLRPASRPSKTNDNIEFDYTIFDKNNSKVDVVHGMTVECKDEKDKNSLYSLLKGVQPGEDIKGEIVYPGEFPVIELHGKPVTILLKVKEVKEKVIPQIDDNFAKTFGLNSLKDLKETIYKQLSGENELIAKNLGQDQLIDKLFHNNDFEVPEALIDYYLRKQMEEMKNVNKEDINEDELRRLAENKARLNIILDRIADREKIEVSNDEIEKIIEKEAVRESVSKEELRRFLNHSGRLEDIISLLKREKAYDFLQKNFLIKG